MQVTLYKFAKRANSTARPTSGDTRDGNVNSPCSILRPSMTFRFSGAPEYNYLYIPEFGRYYTIDEWTFDGGAWTCSASVDVLASWREDIGNSVQYVTRASAARDSTIIDSLYPTKASPSIVHTYTDMGDNYKRQGYVVGVVGNGADGAVTYYCLSEEQYKAFSAFLMGGSYLNGADFGEGVTLDYIKTVFNPFQYIVSVMKFPMWSAPTTPTPINFGWWNDGPEGSRLYFLSDFNCRFDVTLPKHPQGGYHNSTSFTKYELYHPLFGVLPIDADKVANADKVTVKMRADPITGRGDVVVINYIDPVSANTPIVATATMQIGANMPIAQIAGGNPGEVFGNYIGAVTAGLTGNYIGYAQGLASAVESMWPSMQVKGGGGSAYAFNTFNVELCATFYEQVDPDNENRGSPLCKSRRIADIPGYIVVSDADVQTAGTAEETRDIKSMMEGGFYYE